MTVLRSRLYDKLPASRFANDRGTLTRNDRFIDAGNAFNDFAISRNQMTRFTVNDVTGAQL